MKMIFGDTKMPATVCLDSWFFCFLVNSTRISFCSSLIFTFRHDTALAFTDGFLDMADSHLCWLVAFVRDAHHGDVGS